MVQGGREEIVVVRGRVMSRLASSGGTAFWCRGGGASSNGLVYVISPAAAIVARTGAPVYVVYRSDQRRRLVVEKLRLLMEQFGERDAH